jgi:hypothetical protein
VFGGVNDKHSSQLIADSNKDSKEVAIKQCLQGYGYSVLNWIFHLMLGIKMISNHKTLLVACIATLLAACGGGGDSGSSSTPASTPVTVAAQYGSVYINKTTGAAAIIARASSQAIANAKGLELCLTATPINSNCTLYFEFGDNLCGALYRSIGSSNSGSAGTFGGGTASTAIVAEALALTSCKNGGGTNCLFGLSACNGTGTPSSNSTIAINIQYEGDNLSGLPYSSELSPSWTAEEPK